MHLVQLKNGVSIPLDMLTKAGISYLPCGLSAGEWQPLVRHAHLWETKTTISLDTFKRGGIAAARKMTGIQIFTGFPTNRQISRTDFLYLNDIDIEKRFIDVYRHLYQQVRDIYFNRLEGNALEIETKSGGRRLSAFTPYVGHKLSFRDTEGMLLEVFAFRGLSRLDHQYTLLEGSFSAIPTLPKHAIQDIYHLMSEVSTQETHQGKPREVVGKSQIGNLSIQWDSDNRSQLFPTEICPFTTHLSNRNEVRFTRYRGGAVDGICFNCGNIWWEVPPRSADSVNKRIDPYLRQPINIRMRKKL